MTTPEEREARRDANKRAWAAKREQEMETRRELREKAREEKRQATQMISFDAGVDSAAYLALPAEKRKELLKEFLWNVAMNSPNVPAKDRLTAAGHLSRLEGFEKQEVEIKIDAVSQFFEREALLMDSEPPAWQAKREEKKAPVLEADIVAETQADNA